MVANSMVSANKTGEARVAYNTRVAECKLGLEMLKRERPEAANAVLLKDFMASVPDWREALDALPDGFEPKKRCRHVLTEAARVEQAAMAAEDGNASALGMLMNESHESCARDYEISCPELDELVAIDAPQRRAWGKAYRRGVRWMCSRARAYRQGQRADGWSLA